MTKRPAPGPKWMGVRAGRPAPLDLDALAIAALSYLGEDQARLTTFLSITGIDPGQLRRTIDQPDVLRGILSYLVSDERLLLGFAADRQLDAEAIGRAVMVRDANPDGSS